MDRPFHLTLLSSLWAAARARRVDRRLKSSKATIAWTNQKMILLPPTILKSSRGAAAVAAAVKATIPNLSEQIRERILDPNREQIREQNHEQIPDQGLEQDLGAPAPILTMIPNLAASPELANEAMNRRDHPLEVATPPDQDAAAVVNPEVVPVADREVPLERIAPVLQERIALVLQVDHRLEVRIDRIRLPVGALEVLTGRKGETQNDRNHDRVKSPPEANDRRQVMGVDRRPAPARMRSCCWI